MTKQVRLVVVGVVIATGAAALWLRASAQQTRDTQGGQTVTPLTDGRWLIVGGETTPGVVQLVDPRTGVSTPISGSLQAPRAWHTATILPDGTVLITGGRLNAALIETAEIFDPNRARFTVVSMRGALARASHSATLLTDGRVLIAGGTNGGVSQLVSEIWDLEAHTATALAEGGIDRSGQTATLLADGRVLLSGGQRLDGRRALGVMIVDPIAQTSQFLETVPNAPATPFVATTIPVHGAADVPVDTHMTVRFSGPIAAGSSSNQTLTLTGPRGPVATTVVAAESGRLAFVWPTETLQENATYTLTVSGPVDPFGVAVAPTAVSFTTKGQTQDANSAADAESWIPDAASLQNGWRTNRPPSPWERLAPLTASPGVTAISGRVLTLDGRPLPRVTLEMEGAGRTESDRTGRFLLTASSIGGGRHVLEIDGQGASRPGRQYGFFEYGMTVVPGQTNVLSFTIWMPRLDTLHTVRIPLPTTSEVVITTPHIPGLEVHLPPNTVIRGEDGRPVTELGITPIPVDRPPFPLAEVEVPVYFTIQPGGAYVYTGGTGPKGAWVVYPNYRRGQPGQRVQFYHYDPRDLGWYVYGPGTVTANAAQVIPDPRTRIYEFTGAMINCCNFSPPNQNPASPWPAKMDPVDPSTGIFIMQKTDLYLPDVMPLVLTRTYESGDTLARPFGRGMTHPYAIFLWSAQQYQEVDLILADGGKIHYVRTSPGTGYTNAVFEHTTTPSQFYKSTIAWNGNGWNLALSDGTLYVFGDEAPLQAIRDRYGNQITITWSTTNSFGAGVGNIVRVTAPNGRWFAFMYDTSNRITQASDNIGRTVGYTYDVNGNLSTVTDPENNVTTYTWDASNRLATIRDGRNIVYLTNTYMNGRLTQQMLADQNATYQLAYTLDANGNITQADITDPRGTVERLAFNSSHYVTADTQAYGHPLARTTSIERQLGSNLITAVTDALNRRTEYTYDGTGHVLTTTRLAGTADAVTTTFTYEPTFFQLATITDPLNHTWTCAYSVGKPVSLTDPLGHQKAFVTDSAGKLTSITDPLQHTWHIGYTDGDLTSVTDPLAGVHTQFVDAAGRVVSVTDPQGRLTRSGFNKLNRLVSKVDRIGGLTSLSYDANGNTLTLIDPLAHGTTWTYDSSDRLATRTDPLSHSESYQYDTNDNITQITDRNNQVTSFQYDALNRVTQMTYADASTIQYVYDAADRIIQTVDSLNGVITRVYDGLDRLTAETTSEGAVNYVYDADDRRVMMMVSGQPSISYTYDNAHRLTAVSQGTATVLLAYDDADRRTSVTYPNGIVASFINDAVNQFSSLTYSSGQTTLGDLVYTYDAAGNRTSVGGSLGRTGLPGPLAIATYDAANRITAWNGTNVVYDFNGNLINDGLTSYTWNPRGELAALSGAATASFAYDAVGRRRRKTVNDATTNFLYDGLNIVLELSNGGVPTASLLTGLRIDEVLTRTDASGTNTFLSDALGSAVELADSSGVLQTHYTYTPFGAVSVAGATNTNTLQFTGRENDGTGLYAYRARYYHPSLQRFISDDPLGFEAGDLNLATYVGNQPTMWRDPSGLVRLQLPPGHPCRWPPDDSKSKSDDPPPKKPPLSWWIRCSPFVVPDLMLPDPDLRPGKSGWPRFRIGWDPPGVNAIRS